MPHSKTQKQSPSSKPQPLGASESASQTLDQKLAATGPVQNKPAGRVAPPKKSSRKSAKAKAKADRKSGFIDPKQRDPNREEELRTLSLSELKTRYKNTYQKDAVLNDTDDQDA